MIIFFKDRFYSGTKAGRYMPGIDFYNVNGEIYARRGELLARGDAVWG
jgi:hypothetical protein